MNLKDAMKKAKETRQPQKLSEPMTEPLETKVTVNMRVDLEVLNKLKAEAEYRGIPYQTLIHMILTLHTRRQPVSLAIGEIDAIKLRIQEVETHLLANEELKIG